MITKSLTGFCEVAASSHCFVGDRRFSPLVATLTP